MQQDCILRATDRDPATFLCVYRLIIGDVHFFMAKDRVEVPSEIASEVLFASDYTCCVCNSRDFPIQIHHIDDDPSNNAKDNLAALCTPCHDKTLIKGGFGRKLDASLVIQYRNDWIKRVATRRDKADELAALRMANIKRNVPATQGRVPLVGTSGPNLIVTSVEKTAVLEVREGVWTARPRLHDVGLREAEWLKENGPRALIIQFTNEAREGSANAGCLVKAALVFRRRDQEIRRVTGDWLEEATDMVEFRVDESHGLLVGLISGNQIQTVAKRRTPTEGGSEIILTDTERLATDLADCTVSVRLTNADTGRFLVECKYRVDEKTIDLVAL
jgi:hypothetical protein